MEQIVYNCTSLAGTNKAGNLKPDESGYYEVVLGAFDFKNSAGENYPFASAKHLFTNSSSLMRRIRNGQCNGELGHPKKLPGMSYRDYIQRILEIREDNISHHIRSIKVDNSSIKDEFGKSVIAVIGEIKPSGPYGNTLKESMENPSENVAFSVRSLVSQSIDNGEIQKHMKILVTWDRVTEPGISIANKYNSPSMEVLTPEYNITKEMIDTISTGSESIGNESIRADIRRVKTELGWDKVEIINLPSMDW